MRPAPHAPPPHSGTWTPRPWLQTRRPGKVIWSTPASRQPLGLANHLAEAGRGSEGGAGDPRGLTEGWGCSWGSRIQDLCRGLSRSRKAHPSPGPLPLAPARAPRRLAGAGEKGDSAPKCDRRRQRRTARASRDPAPPPARALLRLSPGRGLETPARGAQPGIPPKPAFRLSPPAGACPTLAGLPGLCEAPPPRNPAGPGKSSGPKRERPRGIRKMRGGAPPSAETAMPVGRGVLSGMVGRQGPGGLQQPAIQVGRAGASHLPQSLVGRQAGSGCGPGGQAGETGPLGKSLPCSVCGRTFPSPCHCPPGHRPLLGERPFCVDPSPPCSPGPTPHTASQLRQRLSSSPAQAGPRLMGFSSALSMVPPFSHHHDQCPHLP